MYRFLCSKKGYTFMEMMIVVALLGILVAVGVPIYFISARKQRVNDCKMQREVIAATVNEIMTGMMDSGKQQPSIDMAKIAAANKKTIGGVTYVILDSVTLREIRGGYRQNPSTKSYDDGCLLGNYLKKDKLGEKAIRVYLSNEEIPVCPFVEKDGSSEKYLIDSQGNVLCEYELKYPSHQKP